MTEGTCSVAPRKPFATPVTRPTNSAIFQRAFLDLWTLKHTVEDRGARIGWPLVRVDHRSLCEKGHSIPGDGEREDAEGGCDINVKIPDGWH